ncbi:Tetratricopeptide repeat-containing protein [Caminicella sporogenes DSM 14501]|uniref:Tetratricopeptide repeat-containing protein n=1 Tax=Caminicella sporogenes DSM 14501 TaxID=1121266 RepID=A0A1M6PVG3_9FIRM|nr:O-antigen ligase family protein [Caminicella sporogenes]RKD21954.1 hypothetical protein BET04_06805 [Caminicella sporogenes]SHK11945.1 Tetratricopeptide repeat-containing protein [Caminicella sporogenes DSM 14501]
MSSTTIQKNSIIEKLIFVTLCILLFYPPFFRGLFFQKELLITHIITFAVFTIWLISKFKNKDFRLFNSLADLLALGIVLMYFISTFYGVNKRLAVAEFLKYANYFAIYLMVRYFAQKDSKNSKIIINTLLLSGVVVSIIGIGSAIGTFNYNGAFVGGRINSTFQYPNTLASYLIALYILAIGLIQIEKKEKKKYLYISMANIYIFTFIPTLSRGMWLLTPIVLLLYFVLIPNIKKIQTIIYYITTIFPALFFSSLFIKYLQQKNVFILWLMVIFSIAVSLFIFTMYQKFFREKIFVSYRAVTIIILSITIAIALFSVLALNLTQPLELSNIGSEKNTWKAIDRPVRNVLKNKEYRLESDVEIKISDNKPYAGRIIVYSISDKGKTEKLAYVDIKESGKIALNFKTKENTEFIKVRFLNYYKDTKVKFLNASIYDNSTNKKIKNLKLKYKFIPEKVISRFYAINSNERSVKGRINFYKDGLKVAKDYFLLGAGGGAWQTLYFKYQSYMYWTTQAHNYFLQLWIETGIIGLLIYIGLIVILILHFIISLKKLEEDNKILQIAVNIGWISILAHSIIDFDLSLGAMSILLWCLYGLSYQRKLSTEKNKIKSNTTKYISTAVAVLLLFTSWSLHLGQIYADEAVKLAENKKIIDSMKSFEKASKYDPFTSNYLVDLSTVYSVLARKDKVYIKKACEAVDKAVKLDSYNSKILMKAGEVYLNTGDFNKGIEYIEKAVKLQPMNIKNYRNQGQIYLAVLKYFLKTKDEKNIEYIIAKIEDMLKFLKDTNKISAQPLGYDKGLNLLLQKLEYVIDNKDNFEVLKDIDKIVMYNKFNWDLDRNNLPDKSWIVNRKNGQFKLDYTDKGSIVLQNDGRDYGYLMLYDLNLEKDKEYVFKINYKSNLNPSDFDIYLYDYTKKTKVIARFENLEKQDKFAVKEFNFKISDNIEKGKQRLGIIHRGNGGKIEIKDILIKEK